MRNSKFAFVDVETTGLSHWDRIVEVGIVIWNKGKYGPRFSCLVNPGQSISRGATDTSGITNKMVKCKPKINQYIRRIRLLLRNAFVVTHTTFDLRFLRNEIGKRIVSQRRYVDLRKFSKNIYKNCRRHRLIDVRRRLGIKCLNAHRALPDAITTARCFFGLIRKARVRTSRELIRLSK